MNPAPHGSADTIVAVSSPPGRSPRGLIRITGNATRSVLRSLLDTAVDDLPHARLSRVRFRSPDLPALLTCFKGPHSYTGQDTAELQVPGHPALLDRLLHKAIGSGARLAEPGEFTFRAYLAGKIDLTQAEGIAATINATSDSQLKAASLLLDGRLGQFARELVDDLGTRLALTEAGIDFTDQEDVVPITPGELDSHLQRSQAQLADLLTNSRSWGEIEALPWVVLVGEPSAGKSTLFNALLARERAVIDPMPGTTRDVLCEPLRLHDGCGQETEVMLVDLAGLGKAGTGLDQQIQDAAHKAIQRADLVLHVIGPDDPSCLPMIVNCPIFKVQTKSDLRDISNENAMPPGTLSVSAATGNNIDVLRKHITGKLGDSAVSLGSEMLALQPRHEQALREAYEQVSQARRCLEGQPADGAIQNVEWVADHLREALNLLAGLGGELTPDDVIGRVFATFCVGK